MPGPSFRSAVGREFRDVPSSQAVLSPSEGERRIVYDGVHIRLDALRRVMDRYEADVTHLSSYRDPLGLYSVNFSQVRLTFRRVADQWVMLDRRVLVES